MRKIDPRKLGFRRKEGPLRASQQLLDAAVGALALQALLDNGLIESVPGAPKIAVRRCVQIRDSLMASGFRPTPGIEIDVVAENCSLAVADAKRLWEARLTIASTSKSQ